MDAVSPDQPAPNAQVTDPGRARVRQHRVRRVIFRTVGKAWDDQIFSMSAQAAFWQTLSLPPLFFALLGGLGYIAGWFGPETVDLVLQKIIGFSGQLFNKEVVEQIIEPTATNILTRGRADVISVGFVISLWAGSSAISSLVDSITEAHGQYDIRHPVWQRLFALLIYLAALVVALFGLPVIALGPELLIQVLPESWRTIAADVINTFYYPGVAVLLVVALTTLYKAALPRSLPWHRLVPGALLAMVVFLVAATGLRLYISAITSTGYTYGALATPIAFLLFTFFIGFAIVLGAQLNNAIEETWPSRPSRRQRRVRRVLTMLHLAELLGTNSKSVPAPVPGPNPGPAGANGPSPDVDPAASTPTGEPSNRPPR